MENIRTKLFADFSSFTIELVRLSLIYGLGPAESIPEKAFLTNQNSGDNKESTGAESVDKSILKTN